GRAPAEGRRHRLVPERRTPEARPKAPSSPGVPGPRGDHGTPPRRSGAVDDADGRRDALRRGARRVAVAIRRGRWTGQAPRVRGGGGGPRLPLASGEP